MLGGARPGPGPPAPRTGLAPRQAGCTKATGAAGQAGRTQGRDDAGTGDRGPRRDGRDGRRGPAPRPDGRRRRPRRDGRAGTRADRRLRRDRAGPGPARAARRPALRRTRRRRDPQPGAHAHRRGGQRGPGGRARPRRRRLPPQALRLPGAGRAHRRAGPPRASRRPAGAPPGGPGGGHSAAPRLAGGPAAGVVAEGVRRPGTAGRRAGPGRLGRGTARTGMGRVRRPVHHRGEDHHQPAAGQARRSPADRDGAQGRLPDRRMTVALLLRLTRLGSRRTIRLRLTLIYGGLFLIAGAGLLAITYVLVQNATAGYYSAHGRNGLTVNGYLGAPHGAGSSSGSSLQTSGGSGSRTVKFSPEQARAVAHQAQLLAASQQANQMHQLLLYSGIALAIMAVVSVALGWAVAGRVLRPLRTISATPSTTCSAGWRPPSAPSASSSPTPPTSCAPRWPGSGPWSRWRSPTPTPTPSHSAPPTNGCSPPAHTRNGSSRRCSPSPAARPAWTTGNRSTSPPWPATCCTPGKRTHKTGSSPSTRPSPLARPPAIRGWPNA